MNPEIQRYTPTARWLHWIMAAIVIVTLLLGIYLADVPKGPERTGLIQWHKSIGSLVLALVIYRLYWRLTHPAPPLPDTIPAWQQKAAEIGHWLLYALMFAQPLGGWVMSSARGFPVRLGGILPLPALVDKNDALADALVGIHGLLGWSLAALAAGHIVIALKHHFIDHEPILTRMLPPSHS